MENIRHKILLVEDDKFDQMAFIRLVEDEKLPYDCMIAASVSEARSILSSETFDVVIADYLLGDGTAFDILDSAKNVPVIFVTGTGNEEIAVKAWKAGTYDYLIKDLERSYLKAVPITVENAIKHKKTEKELRLLSSAIMGTDDIVCITDMNDRIIFVNKAFCQSYGYKEEEVLGKPSNILWIGKPHSEYTRSVFRIVGSASKIGFYHKRKDGSVFPVSLSRSIIKDVCGREVAVVSVARDISDQILVEDELRAANLKLKEQSQVRSELAVTVSEALKTSLTAPKNNIHEAMTDASGEISPELRENLELVDKDIDEAVKVINDFLDISKIDVGRVELELTQFSFQSVVSQVLKALSPLADEKNIELESSVPDSKLVVNADRQRISQVLTNLINNAIKNTASNAHISVQVKDVGNEIRVNVQDTAPVIPGDRIKQIFNPFAQMQQQGCASNEGVTLGLPIAKELVEMHGGCMWVESEGQQGNNFCFTLPKADAREEVPVTVKAAENR